MDQDNDKFYNKLEWWKYQNINPELSRTQIECLDRTLDDKLFFKDNYTDDKTAKEINKIIKLNNNYLELKFNLNNKIGYIYILTRENKNKKLIRNNKLKKINRL